MPISKQNLNRSYNGLINIHRNLLNISKNLDISDNSKKNLNVWILQLGYLINTLKDIFKPILASNITNINKVASNLDEDLLLLTEYLDKIGAYASADIITYAFLLKNSFIPKAKEYNKKEELVQPPYKGSLSTRYCPDHNGVQSIRLSDKIYQCPIDGKVYNYNTGYTNYKGEIVPGGSIAEQTPITSDYGGIPMRIYDSRQNILNNINY